MPPFTGLKPIPWSLIASFAIGILARLAMPAISINFTSQQAIGIGAAVIASIAWAALTGKRSPKAIFAAALVGAFGYLAMNVLLP